MDMKIIVCDDEQEYLSVIKKVLAKAADESGIKIEAKYFTVYDECKAYAEKEKFDVAIIDMYLIDKLGIDLAKDLRSIHHNKFKLIFISDKNSYAAETYELNACGYLLKPLDEGLLKEVLLKCFK